MKNKALTSLIASLTFISSLASAQNFEDHQWHKVLSCDGAHIDNRIGIDRGGAIVIGQIVVTDMGVIRYFNETGVIQTKLLDTSWAQSGGGAFGQAQPGKLLNFNLPQGNDYGKSFVKFDGSGLLVQITNGGANANWYFRNCNTQSN